jgi:lipopolysaccharide transport system permease protein
VATAFVALGLGMMLSSLTVAYRDFRYLVPFVVDTWFFLTPIVWPLEEMAKRFGGRWRLAAALNPMCGITDAFRSAVTPGRPFEWGLLAVSMAAAVALFLLGLYCFRRFERQFADII